MADVSLLLDLRMEVSENTSHRIRKYGFGDGYEAIAKDGINTRQTEYSIKTEPIKDITTSSIFKRALIEFLQVISLWLLLGLSVLSLAVTG